MAYNKNNHGPYRAISRKTGPPVLLYLIIAGIAASLGLGVWYVVAPESLARIYGRFLGPELQINSLAVNVERRLMEIAPDGSIEIHPRQNFSIQGLNSNRWRNYDLRLYSPDFDIASVTDGSTATPASLLGEEAFETPQRLRIEAKEGQSVRAVFEITSSYTLLDFAAKGDAAEDPAQKAVYYRKALNLDPSSKPMREKLIASLIASNQKAEAAELYEEELEQDGPSQLVLSRLLELYLDTSDDKKAINTLLRLIDLAQEQGQSPTAHQNQLASLYKRDGQTDNAAEIYEELLKSSTEEGRKIVFLDELLALYRDSGRIDKEIETLKRLLEVSPPGRIPGLWTEIIALYDRKGDIEGQQESWLALAAVLPEGSNKANAYKRVAFLMAGAQKYDEAIEAYKTALELDPNDLNVYLNLARLSLNTNDRDSYRSYLEKILEMNPNRTDLRRELAEAYYDDAMNAEAKREYENLLEKDPSDQASRLRLIAILEQEGDQQTRLMDEYARLVENQPTDKVAIYNFAVLCFNAEMWDQAIDAFKKVLELDPGDADAHQYLMSAYQKKGQTAEMLAQALELYRLDQTKTEYRDLLVTSYENTDDWPNLAKVANEIIRLQPNDPEGWRILSRAQANQNQPVESAKSLYRAAEAAKTNIDYWFEAARALSVMGELEDAQKAYQKILEIDPENKRAAEALLDLALQQLSANKK